MKFLAQRLGVSPTKLALIVGLTVLLGAVWVNAFRDRRPAAAARRSPPSRGSSPAATRTVVPASENAPSEESHVPAAPRPSITPVGVEVAAARDPFSRPPWAGPQSTRQATTTIATPSERSLRLRELRSTGVSVVVLSGGEKAAVIGDRRVRLGDSIDGFRVLDITANGVVLDAPLKRDAPQLNNL